EAGNRATLEVVVNASGNYFVNGQPLVNTRPETLRAALLKLAAKQEVALTIRADARSTHQAVVTVMDVAGKLGFSNISIVTVNGEQRPGARRPQPAQPFTGGCSVISGRTS